MYNKIVVPLDGSELAEVALPYAEELATKMDCDITLLSVLESADTYEYQKQQTYIQKIVEDTKHRVGKYLEKSGSKPIKVGPVTRVGQPAQGILNYVNKGGLKLLVMATHGRSGIGRWAIGSVADKVVRSTIRRPIMLIRAKGARPGVREKGILKRVLVPLDGSVISKAVIPYISELAARFEAELTFVQVVTRTNHIAADAEGYLQNVRDLLQDEGIQTRYEIRVGAAADEIINLADELNADLVAMTTRGMTGANFWALGSVAQKVLLGGSIPLLLVRA